MAVRRCALIWNCSCRVQSLQLFRDTGTTGAIRTLVLTEIDVFAAMVFSQNC